MSCSGEGARGRFDAPRRLIEACLTHIHHASRERERTRGRETERNGERDAHTHTLTENRIEREQTERGAMVER